MLRAQKKKSAPVVLKNPKPVVLDFLASRRPGVKCLNPVCERRVNLLVCSLSLHRHSLRTKLSFCFGGLITLFQLFHTPCKVRKLSSHQRNSKKGSFVHTPLSTTLSISHFHKSKSFTFRFLQY